MIRHCKYIQRKQEKELEGTWITDDMEDAYIKLHQMGHAKSLEVWLDGELVGGLYGVEVELFSAEKACSPKSPMPPK